MARAGMITEELGARLKLAHPSLMIQGCSFPRY